MRDRDIAVEVEKAKMRDKVMKQVLVMLARGVEFKQWRDVAKDCMVIEAKVMEEGVWFKAQYNIEMRHFMLDRYTDQVWLDALIELEHGLEEAVHRSRALGAGKAVAGQASSSEMARRSLDDGV
jgi:hypothetical protein